MLSAFSARLILEFKQRDKSKIESLLAYGDRLLVGLNSGSLRIYRIKEEDEETVSSAQSVPSNSGQGTVDQTTSRTVELLREEEKFSKRPIQQLGIIRDANVLISLADGHVSFHDLQTYELTERLENTKGASSFAVISNIVKDEATEIPLIVSRLAVAVKRKILVWTWQDMELQGPAIDLTMVASVKSLTWATSTKLITGMDPGFALVDVENHEVTEIYRPANNDETAEANGIRFGAVNATGMGYMGMGSWVPKPMATKLHESEILLAKDVNTLFINADGTALNKRQVPWTTAPETIGYSYPYLMALQSTPKTTLELRNPETLSLLQTIPLPNAIHLHVPQPNISLAHAGKGFLVASDRSIWRMEALRYESQIEELVEKSRFDEAISVIGLLEDTLLLDKKDRLRQVKILKAQSLFDQYKFRDALALFAEAETAPERVIKLYPESIVGSVGNTDQEKTGDNGDQDNNLSQTPPKQVVQAGTQRGTSKRNSKRIDNGSTSVGSRKSLEEAETKSIKSKDGSAARHLEGKDLKYAITELRPFLAETRKKLENFINYDGTLKRPIRSGTNTDSEHEQKPEFAHYILQHEDEAEKSWQQKLYDTAVLVDTTLFRAHMFVTPSLASNLFRLPNFCSPQVVEEKLYETARYNELIEFLYGKGLHKEALELLEKFGKGNADAEAPENLRGPRRTVMYLQQLPFELIDLILQFAAWPIQADPDLGMEIFLADTENAEHLPRERVLEFLTNIDHGLAVRYLEHVIDELKDQTSAFHSQLIDFYLDQLKSPTHDQNLTWDDETNAIALQHKLEDFLRTSQEYNKSKILRQLPTEDAKFYESRAIVLSKLSRHEEALRIYVFQMKDFEKAENYCNRIYLLQTKDATSRLDPDSDSQISSTYVALLSLYLAPPPPNATNFNAALNLLSRHGSRLPAFNTLALLPTELPIKELEAYFRGRMRAANSIAREKAIIRSLSGVEKSDAEAQLLLGEGLHVEEKRGIANAGRSRRIVLNEDDVCKVCNKRFGRSAVRMWPDGQVTHYGCTLADHRRTSPVR